MMNCTLLVAGQKTYAKEMLDSLCSEKYHGRGYVNNGDVKAADFIIRELKKIGVENFNEKSYEQDYSINVNTFPNNIFVALDSDTLIPGVDYLVNSSSGSAKGVFEIIELNTGNLSQKKIQEIIQTLTVKKERKKIIAFNFTDISDSQKKGELKSLAFQCMEFSPVVWVETGKKFYSVGRKANKFPLIEVDSSHYSNPKRITLDIENIYQKDYQTKNVIGLISGQKKEKYIVLSAHYDHLGRMGAKTYFPGANDNASGVAMLMSLAKHYIKNPPKYSIAFCFFSGEEAGLEGSKYFVNHSYFPLKKIKFVLNIDIMGGADQGITVVNGTEHKRAFKKLSKINTKNKYLDLVKRREPTSNSDHYFFSKLGVPAFFVYTVGNVKNYHDVFDKAENTPLNNFDNVQSLFCDFIDQF